jgi:hypothetical protein
MKKCKKFLALTLSAAMALSVCCGAAFAKTHAAGQTVGTVLFYVRNSAGEDILASHISVSEMEADMKNGKVDNANHNYSLLDRYVTTVHQEAQGFTVPEFVTYAQGKSGLAAIRGLNLSFAGNDAIAFWEIDQTGFDEMDTYTYNDLYSTARYNFPLLYQYWNYRTQDYYDPNGVMTRDEVIDHIFENGVPETFLLSVRAFSQRYMATDEKYDSGDYNMENLWQTSGLLDNDRTIRLMKPMTKEELYHKTPTASDTRYWVANLLLDMEKDPQIASLGKVVPPTASMTEDEDNYYVTFSCETPGATILYNHNFISPSYTPSCEYTGGTVVIPKSEFPSGTVTMTCRAVKDGYADAGVQTLKLLASGTHTPWKNPYSDVETSGWYYDYVEYVMKNGLFDPTSASTFSPSAPMTRAMLATALYRMAGAPHNSGILSTPFTDVAPSASYADAVAWCYETGVVKGTSSITFAPNAQITREEITVMFHRYAEKIAKADMTPSDPLTNYTDASKLASWSKPQMQWAVAAGLINGTSTVTLSPQGTTTRAEAAALVMRLASYL